MNMFQKIIAAVLIAALFGSLHGIYLYTESVVQNDTPANFGSGIFRTVDAEPVPLPNRRDLPETTFELQELSPSEHKQVLWELAIDINTAEQEELENLHRVGATTARNIIEYRNNHGPFQTLDDLTAVSGIGPATVENWRGHIRIGDRLIE